MTNEPALDESDAETAGSAHRRSGPASSARLVALSGRNKGNIYLLPAQGEVFLGRNEDSSIVIEDSEISRRHCRIVADGGTYRIEDAHSTNGSFVNGQPVARAVLGPGAKIRLGQTTLVLVLPDETQCAKAATQLPESATPPAEKPVEPRRKRRRPLAVAAMILIGAAGLAAVAAVGIPAAARLFGGGTKTLRVDSLPPGAEVFVDDRFVAMTPTDVNVAVGGPHALRLAKRGYLTQRSRIERDTPSVLTVDLRPEPAATLFVSASRPDTDVFLDGLFVGTTGGEQPLRVPDVRLGQHELRLQRPNYLPYQQRIDVTRPGNLNIHAKLESREESALLGLIAGDPSSALLHTELGHLRMVNKQFDKAMDAYQKAFELVYSGHDTSRYHSRLNAEFQKLISGRLFRYGTAAEMRVACRKLEDVFVTLAPRYPAAKARLAQLAGYYAQKNLIDDAIRLSRKMLDAEPNDLNLHFRTAALCTSKNDYEAAIAILRRAAERFPDNWSVHYRLGLAHLRRAATDLSDSDRQLAISHLEKAATLCTAAAHKKTVSYYLAKARELKFK